MTRLQMTIPGFALLLVLSVLQGCDGGGGSVTGPTTECDTCGTGGGGFGGEDSTVSIVVTLGSQAIAVEHARATYTMGAIASLTIVAGDESGVGKYLGLMSVGAIETGGSYTLGGTFNAGFANLSGIYATDDDIPGAVVIESLSEDRVTGHFSIRVYHWNADTDELDGAAVQLTSAHFDLPLTRETSE